MKRLFKIASTNWIHIVGFLISAYLSGIIFKLIGLQIEESWNEVLFESILTIPLAIAIYGIPILAGFYLLIMVLDFLSFHFTKMRTQIILIIEWVLIVSPFWYWAFEYEFWIWIPLSISFLITQLIRGKWINNFRIKETIQA